MGHELEKASRTDGVLDEIKLERFLQDRKWGIQDHPDGKWALILGEEFGEACQAVLDDSCDISSNARGELLQVAAVAVAWVEAIDRRKAKMRS